ncbi:MAG TPA: aminotransferase class I/II-fold pyridoxal phosphate-dependent enzyme, partial [Phnomibacter sp.]|nr:aminotransferase class I/II-fold pyridoxal phosphate-dependent enzyme [Phnomibacter sp.]
MHSLYFAGDPIYCTLPFNTPAMKLATRFIHAGAHPDPSTGAIMTPIYQTSTYVQDAPGVHKGFEYARSQNPTRFALEEAVAQIENGRYGLVFGSGVAATDAVMKLLQPGDEVIAANDMYGGTYRLFTKVYEKFGIKFHYVNMQDAANIRPLVNSKTQLIWTETPTNPLMNITDIAAVAAISKEHNLVLCVDNTFASPYLQNPLDLGADIVMHSATKYLGGHSDVIQGCLVMNDTELRDQLYFIQKSCGAVPGPMDCFLVLRGIKTLHVRMDRHSQTALALADHLERAPGVRRVAYPGLASHPQAGIAARELRSGGGMLALELASREAAAAFIDGLSIPPVTATLGSVI